MYRRCFWWLYHRVWLITVDNFFYRARGREFWLAPHFCWSVPNSRLWVRGGGAFVIVKNEFNRMNQSRH